MQFLLIWANLNLYVWAGICIIISIAHSVPEEVGTGFQLLNPHQGLPANPQRGALEAQEILRGEREIEVVDSQSCSTSGHQSTQFCDPQNECDRSQKQP